MYKKIKTYSKTSINVFYIIVQLLKFLKFTTGSTYKVSIHYKTFANLVKIYKNYVDALFFHICHMSPCEWWNVTFIV